MEFGASHNYHSFKNQYGWMMDDDADDRADFREHMTNLAPDEKESFKELWGIDEEEFEELQLSGQISDADLQKVYEDEEEKEFAKSLHEELKDDSVEQVWIGDKFVDKRTLSKNDTRLIKKYTEDMSVPVGDLFLRKETA